MATEKRLIDANALTEAIVNTPSEVARFHTYNVLSSLAERQNEILNIIDDAPTVAAFTDEQLASILQAADRLETRNQKLEKECEWLKSCMNCKLRKECPRHCGKVVHGCDHWEYGDNAVDALEVVHGEWSTIEDDYLGLTALQCSECNQEYWFEDEPPIKIYNYCPNCGAKMDGGGNG